MANNAYDLKWFKWLLLPFGILYGLFTATRNFFYNKGLIKGVSFEKTIINIGNLRMGGTGKSPMVAYLAEALGRHYPVAILSRGYGRKSTGFKLAGIHDNAETIGDEPFQYFRKFGHQTMAYAGEEVPKVIVAVGEERILAIPEVLGAYNDREIILLDDAYQHRAVRPDLNILMTTFQQPFYKDWLFPVGWLRESKKGGSRADMVIVSNCPEPLPEKQQITIKEEIRRWTHPRVSVFFTSLQYLSPQPVWSSSGQPGKKVVMVTGIANSRQFENYVSRHYQLLHHFKFPDHYDFGLRDIQEIKESVDRHEGASVITSEKDAARIVKGKYKEEWRQIPLYYIPVTPFFLHGEAEFLQAIDSIYKKKQPQNG